MSMDDESNKALKKMAKIKPNQWKAINTTLSTLKEFIDVDTSVFKSMKEELTNSITLRFESLLSPLKNEINAQINTLLEPLMPFLEEIINGIGVVVGWIADRLQELMNFLGMGQFTVGDYTVESFLTWTSKNQGKSMIEYYYYVLASLATQMKGSSSGGSGGDYPVSDGYVTRMRDFE